MRPIKKIIIHCSDTESGTPEAIRNYHVHTLGWKDVGYHWIIDLEAVAHTGRPERDIGSHCKGHNYNSIGVCLIGKHQFSDEQKATLKFLVQNLMGQYGLTTKDVFAHYELDQQGKTCPNMDADWLRSFIGG